MSGARFVDAKLLAALRPTVDRMATSLSPADGDRAAPLSAILPLALSDACFEKLGADSRFEPECRVDLAKLFKEVEQALRAAVPRIEHELALRAGPLQAQWESFGPGLLRAIERVVDRTNSDPLALRLALVYPICGGYACVFAAANVALCEAVLTDVEPGLPEVLRVGWLVAQQILWTHFVSQSAQSRPVARAVSLAAVALALGAAQELDMASEYRDTIELALKTWRPPQTDVSATAAQIWDWWSDWRDRPWAVPTALTELSRRLAPV